MKIALIGYGKMGRAIEQVALSRGHDIVLTISSANLNELTPENIRKADVAIEFTSPESAAGNLLFCFDNNVPVVCGSTGWQQHMADVEAACKTHGGSLLFASNFSIGVNLFFELNRKLSLLMQPVKDYEVMMTETHHVHKKDAPSGTAITLAEDIIQSGRKKTYASGSRDDKDVLGIISYREDEVPGTHCVRYSGPDDQIEITHTAFNRKGFASGAVAAAEYIQSRKGIFTMKDVLGL